MRLQVPVLCATVVALFATVASGWPSIDDFPQTQRWKAEDDPALLIHEANPVTGKPAWPRSTGGSFDKYRTTIDGVACEVDKALDTADKAKYSHEPALPNSERTLVAWKIRVVTINENNAPVLKVRCGTHRVRLNFRTGKSGGDCVVQSGWTADDGASVPSDGGGAWDAIRSERYLPMSLNEWHTLWVEVDPATAKFTAWLDPELGFSDYAKISGPAGETTDKVIKAGYTESLNNYNEYAINFLGYAQGAAIPVLSEGTFEICGNGLDDDLDGLTDFSDPQCGAASSESSLETCSNGADDDCDGLSDCSDPDCAGITHCGNDQPYFAMTLVRQVGDWQNCGGGCRQVHFSAYDEDGFPLNNVEIKDVGTGCTVTTHTDRGQAGHASFLDESPCGGELTNTTYRFYVSSYQGFPVGSDVTPDMHAWVGPHNPFHAWQVEFILKSRRDNPVVFTPMDPTYIFDSVEMNTPPGPNDTLLDDFSGLDYDGSLNAPGSTMFGQTFVANGNRVISLRAELALAPFETLQYQASIHSLLADPPASLSDIGPQIGPARTGPENMLQSEWWKQMIVWPLDGPDSVPVEPGQKYFLKIIRTDSSALFTAFGSKNWYDGLGVKHSGDRYPNGERYRLAEDGVSLVMDVYPAQDKGYYDMVAYIVGATASACQNPVFDSNDDGHVDASDLAFFESCATVPGVALEIFETLSAECRCMDHNGDQSIDQQDFAVFQRCISGSVYYADPACDD